MKNPSASCVAIGSMGLLISTSLWANPKVLGKIAVKNPAFLQLTEGESLKSQQLLISSFSVSGDDKVQAVTLNAENLATVSLLTPRILTDQLTWPNSVSQAPLKGSETDFYAVATGFLVPGRDTGEIILVNKKTGATIPLTTPKKGFFYHKVTWVDMNEDGRLDALTARAKKPMLGAGTGEMLWLEQPAQGLSGPWTEHLIAKGPDVHFSVYDFNGDGQLEIIATEFFSQKLSVLWKTGEDWHKRVIDDTLGAAFDVIVADINGDAKPDLVVTNHQSDDTSGVFAYEIPQDFIKDTWIKHTLAQGIKIEISSFNAAAPGSPLLWNHQSQKPHILVSGDGSSKVHWLVPLSQDPLNWSYENKTMLDTNSTIGGMAMGDIDGDGSQELFVPAYDHGAIYVINLPPQDREEAANPFTPIIIR